MNSLYGVLYIVIQVLLLLDKMGRYNSKFNFSMYVFLISES